MVTCVQEEGQAYYLVVTGANKPVVVQTNRSEVFLVVTHTTFESDNLDNSKSSRVV